MGSGLCWFLEFFHDGWVKSLNRWLRCGGGRLRGPFCGVSAANVFLSRIRRLTSFPLLRAWSLRFCGNGHKSFLCQVGAWSFDASSP